MPVLLEIAVMFLLLEVHIWYFDRMGLVTLATRVFLIVLVIASWIFRKNTLHDLGILPENWRSHTSWTRMFVKDLFLITSLFFIFWLLVMCAGNYASPDLTIQKLLTGRFGRSVVFYYWGALAQQILMNGYFVNRLAAGMQNQKTAACATGVLFGLAHLPNPVLTPVTFIGGILSAYFFQRNKNVYVLALFHTLLAVTIKYALPHAWHHNLRVGPGFFSCCI
jgi:membrane protease YdiL (CAAX protease family)